MSSNDENYESQDHFIEYQEKQYNEGSYEDDESENYEGYENYESYEDEENYEENDEDNYDNLNNEDNINENNTNDKNIDDSNSNNENDKREKKFSIKFNGKKGIIKQIISIITPTIKSKINKKKDKNSNTQKPKISKKNKMSPLVKKLMIVCILMGSLLALAFYKQTQDERVAENRPTTNNSSKQELTSAELYQQKVDFYKPILNKTLYTLNDKTLSIKRLANSTAEDNSSDALLQIITNTKGNQMFFKISYTNYAVITVFSNDDVYIALTNAKSILQKPIRLYHSIIYSESIRNKIYDQYINIDVLNKQLKNSISFKYNTTKEINGVTYDVLQLNVPRYEVIETNTNIDGNNKNDNGVNTTIAGDGGLSVNKPTSQTEKMLIYINPETKELYRIDKTIDEYDYEITIENTNKLSVTLDSTIEEADERNISMILAGEINFSKTN